MNAIVITGNPVDGFIFYGPFDNFDAAIYWAEIELKNLEWWIAPLFKEVQ